MGQVGGTGDMEGQVGGIGGHGMGEGDKWGNR